PIQRLNIDRQPSADLSAAAKTGALTKVQGDKLMVGAPQKFSKGAAGAPPPKVKAKVAQPKIEKGWTGVSNEAQVKEKIKTENPKNIPPPTRAATGGPAGAASPVVGASPAAPGAPATPPSQTGRPGQAQPGLTGTPAVSPAGSPAPIERGRGKSGGRRQPGATHTPAADERPVARVHRRQGGRDEAVRSKLGLRQLQLQVEGKEGREYNRGSRPLVKLPLQLSAARGNPRAERKKVR